MASVGYFVFTIPPEVRGRYRSKAALGKLGISLKRLLQRHGFTRGHRRWHFFGEKKGSGVPGYHPQLNCLVEGGHLSKTKLRALKRGCAAILGVSVDRVNLRYRYTTRAREILHRVKYVLRSTFKDWRWDPEFASEVVGFRNSLAWGKWDGEPAWEIPRGGELEGCAETRQVEEVEAGRCPFDGTRIAWGEIVRASRLHALRWDHLGGGFWTRGERGGT